MSDEGLRPLSDDTRTVSIWRSVKGFPTSMTDARCAELIAKLRADFPDVDLKAASKDWSYYKIDHPLLKKCNVPLQLANWMRIDRRYVAERAKRRGSSVDHITDPGKYTKGKYGHMVN